MHPIRLISSAVVLALFGSLAASAFAQEPEPDAAPSSEVMLLKLADGSSLWGRIFGHDSERLSFQRLDNGGIVRMPWKQIEPAQSGEMLEDFGYVDHSGDELSLGAVARIVNMSASYFSETFKQATGMNFVEYVSRTRVEKARNLLLNPNRRVSEVAFEVGFQSLSQFNRAFRKVAGQSPREYRAELPSVDA